MENIDNFLASADYEDFEVYIEGSSFLEKRFKFRLASTVLQRNNLTDSQYFC